MRSGGIGLSVCRVPFCPKPYKSTGKVDDDENPDSLPTFLLAFARSELRDYHHRRRISIRTGGSFRLAPPPPKPRTAAAAAASGLH